MPESSATIAETEARWTMSFVADSDRSREPYKPIWEETLLNYLVRPYSEGRTMGAVNYPYLTPSEQNRSTSGYAILKDPESHQIVESLTTEVLNTIFGDVNYLLTRPVGREDVQKSSTASRYIKAVLRQEGQYRSFVEWLKSGAIFGTGILEGYHDYRERDEYQYSVIVDEAGQESVEEAIIPGIANDWYRLMPVQILDFFPDAGALRMALMLAAAKRFTTTRAAAQANPLYDQAAVSRAAMNRASSDAGESRDKAVTADLDRPARQKPHPDFQPLTGYCYYGEVPYQHPDGHRRRRIEVLQGETVRSEPYAGRIPFFEYTPVPLEGRFYGVAPLEVIRYDQDFADALKMLLADASARATHPPFEIDRNAQIQEARLRRFRTDVPIYTNRVGSIMSVPYNPPLQPGFAMYSGLKTQMREGSGALAPIQGLGLGVNRASATEAAGTFSKAGGRVEGMAKLLEREYLPPIGQHILAMGRRFVESTEDLARRIGEDPQFVRLADIHEEYDVEFIGSRIEGSKQQRIAAYRDVFAVGANPYAAALVPWPEVIRAYFEELGLHEAAASIGAAAVQQTMLANAQGPNAAAGNNNGTTPRLPPLGLAPAQLGGGPVG